MFQTAIDGTIQAIVLDKEVGHFNKPPYVAFYTVLQSSQADTRVILYIVYHTADNLPNKTISNQLCSCESNHESHFPLQTRTQKPAVHNHMVDAFKKRAVDRLREELLEKRIQPHWVPIFIQLFSHVW